jgi:cation diffusion facilitator CzcD-associated flavoprotein CzcO
MRINDHPVAIIGAGPVGLSAAAHLLDRGIPFVVFEAGDQAGASLSRWRHVRMFSPWGYNIDKKAGELLAQSGWVAPPSDAYPTGHELLSKRLLNTPLTVLLMQQVATDAAAAQRSGCFSAWAGA